MSSFSSNLARNCDREPEIQPIQNRKSENKLLKRKKYTYVDGTNMGYGYCFRKKIECTTHYLLE